MNPTPTDGFAAVRDSETSNGDVTDTEFVPTTLPIVALIAVLPLTFPVINPLVEMEATVELATNHETELVRF